MTDDWVAKSLREQRIEYKWKYIRRTGGPGHYRYWYRDPKTGKLTSSDRKKEGEKPRDKEVVSQTKQWWEKTSPGYRKDALKTANIDTRWAGKLWTDLPKNVQDAVVDHVAYNKKQSSSKPSEGKKDSGYPKDTTTLKLLTIPKSGNSVDAQLRKLGHDEGYTESWNIKNIDEHRAILRKGKKEMYRLWFESPTKQKSLEVKSGPLDLVG
jgi:hypothetical protein